ncbi:hypothetical protein O4220_04845 [Rhodococcus ruber]|uniref:Uncharacterized protein n=1 Tax=Rhodococcus ruber TaxID=1830 RepID=A0ABT4MA46_9NOCA|nr:hypothetical protein [Rhodococcus ruber]MCZ4517836.1 hypothetical protein [Rhodococcus ruber]
MGIRAARLHGLIPRALATAMVAVPTRHDPIGSAEQTVLDSVKRPGLGDAEGVVWPAVEQLYLRCDPEGSAEIAGAQKMRTTSARLGERR